MSVADLSEVPSMANSPHPGRAEKRAAVETWVKKHLGSIAHELRVVRIMEELLELASPFHELSKADRALLELGALVHDVGRSIDDDEHPKHGAAMVLEDASLSLSGAERRTAAYLTRYHRGRVPERQRDDLLASGDDHARARLMLAFLRAADGLDSRWLGSPRVLMSIHRRTIRLECYVEKDTPKIRRLFTRKKKFALLEEELGCRIEIDLAMGDSVRLVA
jgi:exopolyphosphatase/pppGpp-phosphohydrolase